MEQAKELLRTKSYVNGSWVDAESGAVFSVHNPATGDLISCVPDMGAADTKRAINAAYEAFSFWRHKTAKERSQILHRWHDLIIEHAAPLAEILTQEQGKPLAEAKGEVLYGASFIEWFAEEAKRTYGDIIPSPIAGSKISVVKQPVGVCAAITPWNFPIAMITRKAAPALASGCTMIIKPAEATPFSALALAYLAHQAGLPPGVLNVITASQGGDIGGALMASDTVRKISFTGSTQTGKILIRQSADTVKRVSMELGGNAPFIVFDDADFDAAISGVIASKFRNAGQTCVCANRIFVHDTMYNEFAKRLSDEVRRFTVGNGMDEQVVIGPLIDSNAVEKIRAHIGDAEKQGAIISAGGAPHALGGNFFQPTVISDVTPQMRIACEETFGPVAPLIRFNSEEQVTEWANNSDAGLAAYLFTKDHNRVMRMPEMLDYGMVGINTGIISNEVAPFGGVKQSGYGREGSRYGIDEYLDLKYFCYGDLE